MSHSSPSRAQTLDVLRGVAILGILLANISAFAHPVAAEFLGVGQSFSFFAPYLDAFVSGKFRGMLSILVGVGLWMQYSKLAGRAGNPIQSLNRRYGLLVALGAIHGLLIWWGDILFAYGLAALLAIAFIQMNDRTLWRVIFWIGLVAVSLTILGSGLFAAFIPDAFKAEIVGSPSAGEADQFMKRAAEYEIWAYTKGGYLPQLAVRAGMWCLMAMSLMILGPLFVYNMLIGIFLARKGVLTEPSKHPGAVKKLLWVGFGLGLPLNLITLAIPESSAFSAFYSGAIEMCFSVVLSLGYLTLIAVLVEKIRLKAWMPLVAVGRLALSNYVLQSILGSIIFYSWGFGLYGKLKPAEILLVVVGIWFVNIVGSILWLTRFDIGPVEWAWRSVVAKRKLPWTNSNVPPPPVLG